MYKLTLATIGMASLFAIPAFAQNSPQSNTTNPANNSATSSTQQPMSPTNVAQAQQKIMQDLKSDGYTNVRVVPNSFLVHATNKRNEAVVMIINPDSVFSVIALPSSQSNADTPTGNQSHSQGLGNSPTKQ